MTMDTGGPPQHRKPRRSLRSALWFRNTVAATVALGAVGIGVFIDPFSRGSYAEYWRLVNPVTVDRGASASVDGQQWTLGEVHRIGKAPTSFRSAPKGTEIVVVRITRTGTPTNKDLCTAILHEGDRLWKNESFSQYAVKPPDDGTTDDCATAGSLLFSFLVPSDAKPTSIEITDLAGQKPRVRFTL